ncbi:MAG: hypothetical protein QFC55_03915 [Chloroflexota bacterium]|nr:hypothetical protein [Chloroflexota bacterium]
MSNRAPRRQGVIYGPPRFGGDGGGNGALIGRILGIGMVGLALAVLVGAVALVNRPPAATPTRQVGPTASPPPGSPSTQPSATTSPVPTSPGPTPTASPFVPTVQVGPGFVTFGTRLNPDQTVADPRATFVPSDRLVWSGFLTEASDAADVSVRLFKLDETAPNGERLLSEGEARPQAKAALHLSRKDINPSRALDGPGIYLVRYLKGELVLAQGYFELGG